MIQPLNRKMWVRPHKHAAARPICEPFSVPLKLKIMKNMLRRRAGRMVVLMLFPFLSGNTFAQNNCPPNLTLSETIPSGNRPLVFEAANTIISTATILPGNNITYDAGNTVIFSPGFRALDGSTFRAVLEGCGGAVQNAHLRWVDMHTHPMSYLGFGRKAVHGAPDTNCIIPAGTYRCNQAEFRATTMEQALSNCSSTHGGWGLTDNLCGDHIRAAILNHGLDGKFEHKFTVEQNLHGDHQHAGYPDFRFWPNHTSKMHQQMWIDWLRRAYDGGLRVMVALTVNSELLGEILNGDPPFDDKSVADIQIDETIRFVNAHPEFMAIARSKADLQRIVDSDKLAVVLGMEVDKLGNFGKPGVVTNEETVRAEIQRLHNKGIRYIFPIHLINNSFGGTAVYETMFNFANKQANGDYYRVAHSDDNKVQYTANLLSEKAMWGTENAAILELAGILTIVGQIPAPCFNHIKCGPLPGKVLCCGSFDKILNILTASPSLAFEEYKTIPGGHVNSLGLTDLGEIAINEMMKLGMIIDIDHMSEHSMTRAIEIAKAYPGGFYPLNMGHNNVRGENASERAAPFKLIEDVGKLGGMVGVGTADATVDKFSQSFREVWLAMGGRGVAIGSDVNGFERLPERVAGKGDEAASKAFYETFFLSSAIQARSKTENRTWDYVTDGGVSHYGLMPEFFHDVKINGGADVITNLNTSVEQFAKMWEKCESRSATPVTTIPTAARITTITFSGVSSDIHNADCTRFYGTVKLALWQRDAAGNKTQPLAAVSGGGTLVDWGTSPGPNRNVFNLPANGAMLPNVENINSVYSIDPALLDQNRIIIEVTTGLGSAHKDNDFSPYIPNSGMQSASVNTVSLKDVLAQAGTVKSIVVGPFRTSDNRHDIRVHFEVR